MAYADQSVSSRKIVAIGLVALFHAVIGYAFITGLAYNVVKKAVADLSVFDVQEEPPPPEELPPPPPPEQKIEPPPMVSPPPIVSVPNPTPTVVMQQVPVAPPVQIHVEAPPAPPPPPRPSVAKSATPRGNPGTWVTPDDYPQRALREEREGVTTIRFDIDANGRVENCRVTDSSGTPDLDDAACRNYTRRARYTPAQDAAGNKIAEPNRSQRIRWVIPK